MSISQLLADIEASDPGPATAALFDFDGTIIAGYSATVFLRDALTRGELKPDELYELTRALTSFGLGNMGFSALMAVHAQYLEGRSEADYMRNSERLFRQKIARLIYPETRELIAAHKAKGHTVAIVSSATPYQVLPAAKDLGIDHVYSTGLEVVDGVFSGAVRKPTCFGEGKVDAARALASEVGADLGRSFFYSDSIDDIQLLETAGRPVTLNPRKRLKQVTRDRGWPTATFDSRGRMSMNRFMRSVAATGSLVGSVAAALPVYALTGSKRDSLNFSISLFADTCSALIGLDMDVKGEEHLWSHRPAVFMFNHQSKADVAIMARLVRRDVVAVGKKEIQRMPLIGQAMGAAGVVFIDRSNRDKAIESMAPLMDAMRNEGKSLVIAPEGTRAPTRKLAPFKKGGFHMAMQVGVPIVPVVIHNAGDIAPKGDFLFQPGTVRVEVLPPVDTSQWTAAKMNEQVTEVRNLFLKALGQPEQTVKEALKERNELPEDMRPENSGRQKATKKKPTRSKEKAAAETDKKPTGKRRKTASLASDGAIPKPGKRVPGKKSAAATKKAGSETTKPKTAKGVSKKTKAGATAKKPRTTAKAKAAPPRRLKAKTAPAVKPKLAAKS
ncbi:MAG: HAD-IB family hydrolase [Cellvibrionales bacterium]